MDNFKIGDYVKVKTKIKEGDKEKIQTFEGTVISFSGSSNNRNFRVRKVSYGIGVEKIFFLASPNLVEVKVIKNLKTNRAKLYYLRKSKVKIK